jgi:hypothetical protein
MTTTGRPCAGDSAGLRADRRHGVRLSPGRQQLTDGIHGLDRVVL